LKQSWTFHSNKEQNKMASPSDHTRQQLLDARIDAKVASVESFDASRKLEVVTQTCEIADLLVIEQLLERFLVTYSTDREVEESLHRISDARRRREQRAARSERTP